MSEGLVAAASVGVSGKGGEVEGSLRGVGGVGPDPSPHSPPGLVGIV